MRKRWDEKKNKYTKKKVKPVEVVWLHKNNYQEIKMVGRTYYHPVGNIPYMTDETLSKRLGSVNNREEYLRTGAGAKLMLDGKERYIKSLEKTFA